MTIADLLLLSLPILFAVAFTWLFHAKVRIPPPIIGIYNLWDIALLFVIVSLATLLHTYERTWLLFAFMFLPTIFIFYGLFIALWGNGRLSLFLSFSLPLLALLIYLFIPTQLPNQIIHTIIIILWTVGLANLFVQGGLSMQALLVYALLTGVSLLFAPASKTYMPLMPTISSEEIYLTIHVPLLLAMLPIAIQQQKSVNKEHAI